MQPIIRKVEEKEMIYDKQQISLSEEMAKFKANMQRFQALAS
jgi:hypothetical protein